MSLRFVAEKSMDLEGLGEPSVSPLVITIIGIDRPGLVESVAVAVADHGGSWVESRMSRLAGQFAGRAFRVLAAPKSAG